MNEYVIANPKMKGVIRYVTAAPKSGSSYVSGGIVLMQVDRWREEQKYRLYPPNWSYATHWHDWDLYPALEQDLEWHDDKLGKGGAVYKGHFWATEKNLGIIEGGHSKLVMVTRAPVDVLACQYCSILQEPEEGCYNPIFPTRMLLSDCSVDEGINYLITGGYLVRLLMFYADWFSSLDPQWGSRVSFEDYLRAPTKTMNKLAREANIPVCDEKTLSANIKVLARLYIKDDIDSQYYPRGWTGGVGSGDNYLNEENGNEFQNTWNKVRELVPGMELLDKCYPGGRAIGSKELTKD